MTRHRKRRLAAALMSLAMLPCSAATPAECGPRPAFQSLRFEEDWSFLSNTVCATQPLDGLKYITTGDAPARYLSLGADYRLRYERFENPGFGAEVDDTDGYWMQRILAHGDWHLNRSLRAYLQLQSSLIEGRRAGARATDKDTIDVEQMFVDWTGRGDDSDFITIRLGRQEIEFGSARLVTARDGLNDRLSFDGIRWVGSFRGLRHGGWFTRPALTRPGPFDDGTDDSQTVSGAYVAFSHDKLEGGNLAIGYVGRRRDRVVYDQGVGHEDRQTYLVRSWSRGSIWDHNWELGAQLGEFSDRTIRAWYVATDSGYTFTGPAVRPRIGLRVDAASGDSDPRDDRLETFNPLFAATAFSGLAGLIGPSNTIDVAPSLTLRFADSWSVTVGAIAFWRQHSEDGVYAIAGNLLRSGRGSSARHIGNQYTLQMNWGVNRYTSVLATLAYFDTGRFLRESPPAEDVTYLTAWLNLRF